MRARTGGAGGDERVEGDALAAVLVQELLHRHASSRSVRPTKGSPGERGERPVGDRARAADRLDLLGLLDRPQRLDDAVRRLELDAAGAQALPGGVGDVAGLEGDRPVHDSREVAETSRAVCTDSTPSIARARSR